MKNLLVALCFLVLPLCAAISQAEAQSAQTAQIARSQSLAQEVKTLQDGLTAKEAELGKLRHKWLVSKGRTPTKDELAEFEKKRAKGTAKAEDNPYVNKSPLSSPGRWRAAYYEKLAEINKVKERLAVVEQELAGLQH